MRSSGPWTSRLEVVFTRHHHWSFVIPGCRLSATKLSQLPFLERSTVPRHVCTVPTEFSGSRLKTHLFSRFFPATFCSTCELSRYRTPWLLFVTYLLNNRCVRVISFAVIHLLSSASTSLPLLTSYCALVCCGRISTTVNKQSPTLLPFTTSMVTRHSLLRWLFGSVLFTTLYRSGHYCPILWVVINVKNYSLYTC